jgi:thiamine pyrophosphokinase
MDNKQKNNKTALIVANGEIKDLNKMKEIIISYCGKDLFIISADGGLHNTLEMGFKPNVVIGDMDSISPREKTGAKRMLSAAEFISARQDKDESDTRLAVEHAAGMGIRDIVVTGATGGRLDHTFANIMLLASPDLEGIAVRILTETSEVFSAERSCRIKGTPGKMISIFSLTPYTTFTRTEGLKFELKDEKLCQSPVRGLSNVFTSGEALLEFTDGKLLIIKELQT